MAEHRKMPTIPDEEFVQRWRALQALMAEEGLDALVVNGGEQEHANVRYLSDHWAALEYAGVLMPPSGDPIIMVGPESGTWAAARGRIPQVREMFEYRSSGDFAWPEWDVAGFKSVFEEAGIIDPERIGVATTFSTTWVMLEALQSTFPTAEIVKADHFVTSLREKKSPAEIACLREAFRVSERAVGDIIENVRPGMTECEIVGIAQASMYANGAESEGMIQYVFSGENTRHPICRASHRVVREGDLLLLDIAARVSGYSSAVGRPLLIGKVDPDIRSLVEFARDAHYYAESLLRPGVIAMDVVKQYKQFFADHGRMDNFVYEPCHAIGIIEAEPPGMEITSEYALEKDMVWQLDTFALSDKVGVRWENGVIITDDGVERLSGRYMDIIEIA